MTRPIGERDLNPTRIGRVVGRVRKPAETGGELTMEEAKTETSTQSLARAELEIPGFEEVEKPEVDVVSLGSASYTKMLGRIWG